MNRAERRAAQHQARHQVVNPRVNGSAGPPVRLPRNVMEAFDRIEAKGGIGELPQWGRSIRIGVDYAVRIGMPGEDASAEACDSWAWICCVLGNLAQKDLERGDPMASCEAQEHAAKAGLLNTEAFSLLDQIRDCTDHWIRQGRTFPALPAAQMKVLQAAARGKQVSEEELAPVLKKAQELTGILSRPLLRGD